MECRAGQIENEIEEEKKSRRWSGIGLDEAARADCVNDKRWRNQFWAK